MEDYELERARAWDDTIPKESDAQLATKFEWHEVGSSKKRNTLEQPAAPPRPAAGQTNRPHHVRRNLRTITPVVGATSDTRQRWPQRTPPREPRSRRQPPTTAGLQQRFQPRPLIDHAESEATLLWRERKPAACSVRIPRDIVIDDRYCNDVPTYEKLASELGAFIISEDPVSDNALLEFKIWGDPAKAAEAKSAIITWIDINRNDRKSTGSAKFPKVASLTPTLRARAERSWMKSLKRNAFRQSPPSSMPFECIGNFHWPVDEFRPEETFGMSLQALDPIRMDSSCYITFERDRGAFQVYGKVSDVQSALSRLRRTFFHLCARQISPVRAYFCHSSADFPTCIYLENYHLANNEKPKKSPRGDGMLEDPKQLHLEEVRCELNVSRIRETILNGLRNLHYLRAHLQLRLRLGMFYLESYQEPSGDMYELQEYLQMTEASQFRGATSEEISGRYIQGRLLKLVQGWNDMISPQEAMVEDLSEVRPSYAVEFVFEDSKGDVQLSMVWNESGLDENDKLEFTEPTKKWTRLDRFDGSMAKLIDISRTDLSNGMAWQFDVTSVGSEDASRIPLDYRSFPDRVRLDPTGVLLPLSQKSFVHHNPFTKMKSLRQIVRYHYLIKGTDYTLQISNIQDRNFHPDKTQTILKPLWSLEVFRVEWDTMFGKNESLDIGTKADWDDDIEEWFPKDWDSETDGFHSLIEKLEKIEKRVIDAAAEEEEALMNAEENEALMG